jgi:hypothetical protein
MRLNISRPRTCRERGSVSGIERDTQLVEPGFNQRTASCRGQKRTVSIEQHADAPLLKVADHTRQFAHQHRIANAVQRHPPDIGHLRDDRCEEVPANISRRFQRLEGPRASLGQQVAAIGHLQIEADGRCLGTVRALWAIASK